ncbi:MAG TPA: hypothetical protein PKC21_05385 [Oligoflexia bacterium]|nr:hypothetical protein [Oligoflexia bacterium]HMR24769.1 hypothetical protein [Oligoflexia bacterium]
MIYTTCYFRHCLYAGIINMLLLFSSCSLLDQSIQVEDNGLNPIIGAACQETPVPTTITPTKIYYVSTSGNDQNTGLSPSQAWKTPHHAAQTVTQPGSLIALKRGDIFIETQALRIFRSGTQESPIIWDGNYWGDGEKAVLRAAADRTAPNLAIVNISGASHVIFQNTTIDGSGYNVFGLVVGGTDSYYSPDAIQSMENNIIVQNNHILNCGDQNDDYVIAALIQTWNTDMSDIHFINNHVDGASNHGITAYCGRAVHGATPSTLTDLYIGHNYVTNFGVNGQDRATGISMSQSVHNAVVECNRVQQGDRGNQTAMGLAGNEDGTPQNAHIRYNEVHMKNYPAFSIQNGYAPSAKVYGNFFYTENANSKAVIWLMIAGNGYSHNGSKASFQFFHNTLMAGQGNVYMDDTTTPGVNTFKNNLLINLGTQTNGDSCMVVNLGTSTNHSNNACFRPTTGNVLYAIDADSGYIYRDNIHSWEPSMVIENPDIVDIDQFDMNLNPTSPLIGMGAIVDIQRDINGTLFNNPPSIGAYEYPTQ